MNDQPTSTPAEAAPPAAVQQPATPATPPPAASRWRWTGNVLVRLAVILVAGALVALFVVNWDEWVGANARQSTDDAYVRGDITPLSAQVEGYLRAVPVTDFQLLKAGDLLIEIEDQDYQARVAQAEADLAGAEAAVANLKSRKELQHAQIAEAEDVIAATQADVDRTHQEAVRQRTLLATTYGTQQKVEQADADEKRLRATLSRNLAQLDGQRRQMGVLDTEESQLRAEMKARRAALDLARINLSYTKILAPVDGMVGERGVRPGQYVRVGTQVISVVPLKNVWVIANYKETQLTHVVIGQPAEVRVDTFPGVIVKGWVDSVSPASGSQFALLPPDNATGNFTKVVQRIPVKIRLDPENPLAGRLRPGMSVIATILTDRPVPKPL